MDNQPVITIQNLSCSYTQSESDRVLSIPHLELHFGKIIFLLGTSGSGKSTLLETLGLMNNTLLSGEIYFETNKDKKVEYSSLWKNNDLNSINALRKNFLSFIFQNTNLMENFTAYENICLSQMIKSNAVQTKAMNGAVELMSQVGLSSTDVDTETLSVNLSGGQRQRVSFVRALNTDFRLLLCDEPTGNLDETNAHELLNIVRQNLQGNKTAVIVSHDINLAFKYADEIILITRNKENGYGEIISENIYQRKYWDELNEEDLKNFRSKIVELFQRKSKVKVVDEAKVKTKLEVQPKTYKNLFLNKEGKVLFGKSYLNLFILILILSITFLAIGFANGALTYLQTKIKDPFVNWITIGIPHIKSSPEKVQEMLKELNSTEVKKNYLIKSVSAFKETNLFFYSNNSNESESFKGRLLSNDDPLRMDLFKYPENRIDGDTSFRNDDDFGIVVTRKFLSKLNYSPDPPYPRVIYLYNFEKTEEPNAPKFFKAPIPLRAVIKQIPNRNDFLITNFFYASYEASEKCIFDFYNQRKRILIFAGSNKEFVGQLEEEIKNNWNKLSSTLQLSDVTIDHEKCIQLNEKGYSVSISFNTEPDELSVTENLYLNIMKLQLFQKNKESLNRVFDFDTAPAQEDKKKYDYLSVNFENLEKIDNFSRYVSSSLNSTQIKQQSDFMEVNSGTVKEKNNFSYMAKMTYLITSLLIIFSILAISLFISNLLKTHLNKIKMNIGTYKAFGLGDKESKNIYLTIMLRFIFIGLIISFVAALGLGTVIEIGLSKYLRVEDQTAYFKLFDIQTYLLIGVIILVTILVSYINIKRILSKTPGDLIYNR